MTTDDRPENISFHCLSCGRQWQSVKGGFKCIVCGAWIPELTAGVDNYGAQAKQDMIAEMDGCIEVEDDIRAAKDRPSMERELQELRKERERLREELTTLTGKAIATADDRDDWRREAEWLKHEVRHLQDELAAMQRAIIEGAK